MTNIYRHRFVSVCPNNGEIIFYDIEIQSGSMIHVEHISRQAALCRIEPTYHEKIADIFFERFGGLQVLIAHHHGVDIETRRGFEEVTPGRTGQRVQIGSTLYEKGVDVATVIEHAKRAEILCANSENSK